MSKPASKPLVSIVTPSYNQGQFIEETILSITNQDYPNLEHIVVDGGSTDNTLEILKKYEGSYNLRWISAPDHGQAHAINKGFIMTQGEIIGWLNSDDLYFDTRVITRVVRSFSRHSTIDVLYGDLAMIDKSGLILKIDLAPPFSRPRLLRGCFIPQPATFFRKHVTHKHHLNHHLHYFMDHDYFLRLSREYEFYHLRSVLAAGRHHPQRKTLAHRRPMAEEHSQILRAHGQTFGLNYRLLKVWDTWVTGFPRRAVELLELLVLSQKYDYAFPAKLDGRWNRFTRLASIHTDQLLDARVSQSASSPRR